MTLRERLSDVFRTFTQDNNVTTILRSVDDELARLDDEITQVEESIQLDTATGEDLDAIGSEYGVLGRRAGRSDQDYRQYLKTLVPTFSGRGSAKDVRFAVSAGLNIQANEVEISEDIQNREYQIELYNWPARRSSVLIEMADLADPVGVKRVDPIINHLPQATVVADPGETIHQTGGSGLSSSSLEPISQAEWQV